MRLAALGDDCATLLAQMAAALDAIYEPTNYSTPKVRYVAPGSDIPWDGESLTLYGGDLAQGFTGRPSATNVRVVDALTFAATWWVQILRVISVQTGEGFDPAKLAPSAAAIGRDGRQAQSDVGALIQAAVSVKATYYDPTGDELVVGPVTYLGPTGGLAAVRLALHTSLD